MAQSASRNEIGYIDLPLDPSSGSDQLGIGHYYDGLADFVRRCQTPMTIAVQGDWGTGKTTALNFISNRLAGSRDAAAGAVKVIEFNTWLYSQFDLGESLVFSLAHAILRPIATASQKAKKLLPFLGALATGVAVGGAKSMAKFAQVEGVMDAALTVLTDAATPDGEPDYISRLKRIRADFGDAVEQYCKSEKVDRIVILIDDLDRVEPGRAIEILESLKLFFEVKQCVFVLAVDFEVVVRGVRVKYGNDVDPRKARQYFDKIIQVPFSMPVGSYDVRGLIGDALQLEPGASEEVVQIVRATMGTNPRAIKRLLNSFELLKLVSPAHRTHELEQTMVVMLCAQTAYPKLHDRIVDAVYSTNIEIDTEESVQLDILSESLLSDLDDEQRARLFEDLEISLREQAAFIHFHALLARHLSDADGFTDFVQLRDAVQLTQVTAVETPRRVDRADGAALRPASMEEIEALVKKRSRATTATAVTDILANLEQRLQQAEKPVCWLVQPELRYLVLYASGDASEIMSAAPRVRPRVAALSYSRKGFRLSFGRRVALRDGGATHGAEWDALVRGLGPAHVRDAGMVLRESPSGYPLNVEVTALASSDSVVELLTEIYDISRSLR
ncbi:P-loop NTPase fold protein [Microbacterium sp. 1262]|uniref:KAP family P-loop NTPase fold protein n=1 Tax=Microbacterium sp. 1262 TaxID=3156415 RepID=UPI00339766B8